MLIIGIAEETHPLLEMTLHCFTNSETCRRFGDGMYPYDNIYDKADMRLLKYLHISRRTLISKSAPPIPPGRQQP